jgi:hypothetical protein
MRSGASLACHDDHERLFGSARFLSILVHVFRGAFRYEMLWQTHSTWCHVCLGRAQGWIVWRNRSMVSVPLIPLKWIYG